jgi:hypothetical protein
MSELLLKEKQDPIPASEESKTNETSLISYKFDANNSTTEIIKKKKKNKKKQKKKSLNLRKEAVLEGLKPCLEAPVVPS